MSSSGRVLLVAAGALTGAVCVAGAYAQSPDSAGGRARGNVIEEIIVTAQRRSERLQDVPVSVGVVDGSEITEQNLNSLELVSNRQPSLVVRSAPGGDQIAVRGTSSGFNAGFEQSTATFVDGVYRPRSRSARVALFDIERIEVLRGPQTTFFGANAIAGALNITTRGPGDAFGGNVLAYYTPDDSEHSLEAAVDVPLGDQAAVRLAGRHAGMDAIARDDRLDERGDRKTRQVRLSGRFDVADSVRVDARFDYARSRDEGANALEIIGCPPAELAVVSLCARSVADFGDFDDAEDRRYLSSYLDLSELDMYEGVVTTAIDLATSQLIFTTTYQDQEVLLSLEQANFPVDSVLGVTALLPATVTEDFDQFSQEIRWQSDGSAALTYTLGAYYERGEVDTDNGIGYFQGFVGGLAPAYFALTDLIVGRSLASQDSTTWSGFATASYAVTDALVLSAGLRYSHVEKDRVRNGFIGTIQPFPDGAVPPLLTAVPAAAEGQEIVSAALRYALADDQTDDRTDEEWMPSVNATYQLNPDAMLYASYVHGFKAGGFNLGSAGDTFDPEEADAFELGAKTQWFDRRVTANVALFRVDYDNLQEAGVLYTPSGASFGYIGNVAESRAEGVELETSLRATDRLLLAARVGYLRSKYRSYQDGPCSPYQAALRAISQPGVPCQNDLAGATRSNAPKWTGSVSADYAREIGDGLELRLAATAYFRSKYYLQSLPEDLTSQSGFGKVDLRAALGSSGGNWELALIGQNVLDKDTSTFAGHGPTSPGSTQRIADRGRVIGLQLMGSFR